MQQISHAVEVSNGRQPSRGSAYYRLIAANRRGRVQTAVRRALIINPQAKTRDLLDWAYPCQPRKHWHYWSVYRALRDMPRHGL